jgi:hypothetical protein
MKELLIDYHGENPFLFEYLYHCFGDDILLSLTVARRWVKVCLPPGRSNIQAYESEVLPDLSFAISFYLLQRAGL